MTFIVITGVIVCVVFIGGDLEVIGKMKFSIISTIILTLVATYRAIEILMFYLTNVNDPIGEIENCVEIYCRDCNQARAVTVMKNIFEEFALFKNAKILAGIIEFSNNVGFFYIILLFILTNYVNVPVVSEYMDSGSSELVQTGGFALSLIILITIGFMCFIAKICISYYYNKKHNVIMEHFRNVERGLNFMSHMPLVFQVKEYGLKKMEAMANSIKD